MRAGHAYANVHTTKWPGGEIRAQLNDGTSRAATTATTRRGTTTRRRPDSSARSRQRERRRPRPVDDAMVERDRDVANVADDDLTVDNDGARGDPVDSEDADLGMVHERRHDEAAELPGARDGEGAVA